MVKIRLARGGAKKNPFYSIVATDSRKRRDSGYIERIGFFNPVARGQEVRLQLEEDRLSHWISQGAQISDRVKQLVKEYRDPSIREKQLAKHAAKADDKAKKIAAADKAKADLEAKEAAEVASAAAPAAEAAAEVQPSSRSSSRRSRSRSSSRRSRSRSSSRRSRSRSSSRRSRSRSSSRRSSQQKRQQLKRSQRKSLQKNNLVSKAPHSDDKKLLVGKINGFFGLQGWVNSCLILSLEKIF